MSAVSDTRKTALEIINAVLRKMGESPVTTLTQTRYSTVLLELLNETLADIDDYGDWEEGFAEADITIVSGQGIYSVPVAVSGMPVKRISQVFWKGTRYPLSKIQKSRLAELSLHDYISTPSFWTMWQVDGVSNPQIRIHPRPSTPRADDGLKVMYYQKTPYIKDNDADYIPLYPATVIIKGLYLYALLEQNDGEASAPIQAASLDYEKAKREALNRFTNDSGTSIRFVPSTGWGRT